MEDAALLAAFARERSEEAFQELVRRHVGIVYSVCLRQLRDAHWAEDVTQAVFILLARKAAELPEKVIVGGWLYKTAFYACSNARDLKRTRVFHENRVMPMQHSNAHSPQDPVERAEMENLLDAGLMELNKSQREVLVLRFFENKSIQEVAKIRGQTLYGTQKSLDAGLAKLRRFLAQRGVSVTAAVAVAVLAEQSAKAIPAGLAATVGTTALATGSAVPIQVAELVGRLAQYGARAKFIALFAGSAACVLLGLAGIAWGENILHSSSLPATAGRIEMPVIAALPRPEQIDALQRTLHQADTALRHMDTASLAEVVWFGDGQQSRDWDAMARVFKADLALKQIAEEEFGPEARQLSSIKTFAERLDEITPQIDAANCQWQVSQDTAAVHFIYRGTGAGTAGGTILFVNIGGQWKIDAPHSLDIAVEGLNAQGQRVAADGLNELEQTHLWEKMALLESSFSRVRAHMIDGQLHTLKDARADLQSTGEMDGADSPQRAFFRLALRLNERQEPRLATGSDTGRTLP